MRSASVGRHAERADPAGYAAGVEVFAAVRARRDWFFRVARIAGDHDFSITTEASRSGLVDNEILQIIAIAFSRSFSGKIPPLNG